MALEGNEGTVTDPEGIMNIAVNYYKKLFGFQDKININLKDDFWEDGEKVTDAHNCILDTPFSEKEIKDVVFGSYAEGAPGPDGFPFLFYQQFWDLIKGDLFALFQDWEKGDLDLFRLNFSLLTLVPKEADATRMEKFRPLAMINCSFKIFAKCATNKFGPICKELISLNQTTFIKGRFIAESIIAAHEVIHSLHFSKQSGFVFKLDYEKAYDMINKEFLMDMMHKRGFSTKWMKKVESLLYKGFVGVNINNSNIDFFVAGKGVRQGDPYSPLIFNLVADIFTRILVKASRNNILEGLFPSSNSAGIISMQYADGTLLLLSNNTSHARNLKWLLSCFEQLSGMRINFHKCDLVPININEDDANIFAQILGCKLSEFPIKYLGAPFHHRKQKKVSSSLLLIKLSKEELGGEGDYCLLARDSQ